MAGPIEGDIKIAASTISKTSPNDPIANSFAQYKAFAHLRCSVTEPTVPAPGTTTKKKGSVSLVPPPKPTPDLVLAKWVDSEGVVRTRNTLDDAASQEHFTGTRFRRFEREMHRALDMLVNKDDIRDHLLLNSVTVDALQLYADGDYLKFMAQVLANKLITSDMLIRITRGPIFEDWMVKQMIFEAVMKSAVDFDKPVADNAVAATAHFIANNGMVIGRIGGVVGHEEWKAESEAGLEKYFDEIDSSATTSSIFTLFNQIILQFGTPANIGSATVEDLIGRAALAYAIILQASSRAVEQLVRDTTAHAAKISLDVSVIFAAITIGGSVTPSPYVEIVVDSVEGVIQSVIDNYVNQPVTAVTAVATNLNDQFSNYILKPALAGDSVPGLFPGDKGTATAPPSDSKPQAGAGGKAADAKTDSVAAPGSGPKPQPGSAAAGTTGQAPASGSDSKPQAGGAAGGTTGQAPATPVLTPAAKRRQLGQLFESKYQDYIGMLDTVHTPMRKI